MIIGKPTASVPKKYGVESGSTLFRLNQPDLQINSTPIVRSENFGSPVIKLTDRNYQNGEIKLFGKTGGAKAGYSERGANTSFDLRIDLSFVAGFPGAGIIKEKTGISTTINCQNPNIAELGGFVIEAENNDQIINITFYAGTPNKPSATGTCAYELLGGFVIYLWVPTKDIENINTNTYFNVQRLIN